MRVSNHGSVPVYTVSGVGTARQLPDWLIRKRKRSLKDDPEWASRVELLQDFEFPEASQCVRVSEDGNWLMSTGTYKPSIHVYNTNELSLAFERHTNALNQTFLLLGSDYSKSLHLQTDRFLEFHTPSGCHYTTRVPRFGRDLAYDTRSCEALIPAVGLREDGYGEVFRLNLEVGKFLKGYQVDVGDDDSGAGLQGGVDSGAVNTAAVASDSHNLLAFGTSIGTVECFDPRSRGRVGILQVPQEDSFTESIGVSKVEFASNGLELAVGTTAGVVSFFDLRRNAPIYARDQGYGYPIQDIIYLDQSSTSRAATSEAKVLTSDKRIIKIWERDSQVKTPWTSVEPAVDIHNVAWCPDSGMLLTSNEGRQQHAFFIPRLGPAPHWCQFLDTITEEMAEDPNDPAAYGARQSGEVYDNYKFLTLPQLRQLSLDHLVGTTSLLRPYMHGYFVAQRLYEEARLIANPDIWQEQRAKSIQDRINKERESRIRGNKQVKVKVNQRLAERMMEREEKRAKREAQRILKEGGDADMLDGDEAAPAVQGVDAEFEEQAEKPSAVHTVLSDPRFAKLFQEKEFEIDEDSREFNQTQSDTKRTEPRLPKGLTAVDQEELDERKGSDMDKSSDDDHDPYAQRRKESAAKQSDLLASNGYLKTRRPASSRGPQMVVSSSGPKPRTNRDRSFGSRAATTKDRPLSTISRGPVGEKEITFAPASKKKAGVQKVQEGKGRPSKRDPNRRDASLKTIRNQVT